VIGQMLLRTEGAAVDRDGLEVNESRFCNGRYLDKQMFGFEYECDRCNACGSYSSSIDYYRLEDGTEFPRSDQSAWCFACHSLRSAERLWEADHLREIIRQLEEGELSAGAGDTRSDQGDEETSRQLHQLQWFRHAYQWRLTRQSPPRCLECGSTDLRPLAPGVEDRLNSFEHPGCGGTFRLNNYWHGSQARYQILSAEGLPSSHSS
jgi:hypothetical protein